MQNAPRQAFFLLRALDKVFASPQLPAELCPKEDSIRNATNLWLAWYLWSRGFPFQAGEALKEVKRFRQETAFIQLKNWRESFHQLSAENGLAPIGLDDFLDLTLPILALPAPEEEKVRILFRWWWTVWLSYALGTGNGLLTAGNPNIGSTRDLVKLAQDCISSDRHPTPPAVVDRLWQDAVKIGIVPPVDRREVITLYLNCYLRALSAGRIGSASVCLGKALKSSTGFRAVFPWYQFMRSGAQFYLRNRREPNRGTL